ncbi:MAG: TolC family protein, partial [Telluria sp.]
MLANRWERGAAALACTVLLGACRTVGPDFERPRVPWLDHWNGGSLALLAKTPAAPRGQRTLWWR